jgi:hypothetical protein
MRGKFFTASAIAPACTFLGDVAVISRDVFILVGSGAINIVTGFRPLPAVDAGQNQHHRPDRRHRRR